MAGHSVVSHNARGGGGGEGVLACAQQRGTNMLFPPMRGLIHAPRPIRLNMMLSIIWVYMYIHVRTSQEPWAIRPCQAFSSCNFCELSTGSTSAA